MVSEIRFARSGWVQQIDVNALIQCAPDIRDIVVRTAAGRYAVEGAVLCTLSALPEEPEAVERAVRRAVVIGKTRTAQQDVSYGMTIMSKRRSTRPKYRPGSKPRPPGHRAAGGGADGAVGARGGPDRPGSGGRR